MINYFNFRKIENHILITNDMGHSALLTKNEFISFITERLDSDSPLFSSLCAKHFIIPGNPIVAINAAASSLKKSKSYLARASSLHVFVLTNQCNMSCRYCQARSSTESSRGHMTEEVALRAVDIALQSPDDCLTFDMQGGEPLLNFSVLKRLVEYAEQKRQSKTIHYFITTNGSLIDDDMLAFFEKYNISVSVSIDGPKAIQNNNRIMNDKSCSYTAATKSIPGLRDRGVYGGAVLTTTNASLKRWKEIIDDYLKLGENGIFLRPLTPLGYANEKWDDIGYDPEEFIKFYANALQYILDLNKHGVPFTEMHTAIFLKKILQQKPENYMELRSPCGASIGQIAYYYDGEIYSCDEGRMLAQMGDDAFRLGNVFQSTYPDLINSGTCQAVCKASILEALPACAECAYMPFCGVCPATIYALEKNLLSRSYNNYRCRIYKGMLDTIFSYLTSPENRAIFESWI